MSLWSATVLFSSVAGWDSALLPQAAREATISPARNRDSAFFILISSYLCWLDKLRPPERASGRPQWSSILCIAYSASALATAALACSTKSC